MGEGKIFGRGVNGGAPWGELAGGVETGQTLEGAPGRVDFGRIGVGDYSCNIPESTAIEASFRIADDAGVDCLAYTLPLIATY